MHFEWNREKARRNLVKHGIPFSLAQRVWDDPLHVIVPDRVEDGEQRWHAIGQVGAVAVLVVVHVHSDEDEQRVRIIGARKATARERRRYEQQGT